MTSWFERGRPALFEALNTVCQQIDQELLAELGGRENGATPLPGDSSENGAGYDTVERAPTNAHQGQAAAVSTTAQPLTGNSGDPSNPTSAADKSAQTDLTSPTTNAFLVERGDWKNEYAKLRARYNALSDNFKRAKEALQKRRDERNLWIRHAELLEKKIKVAEVEHGIQVLDSSSKQARASGHLETDGDVSRSNLDASFVSDGGPHADPPAATLAAKPMGGSSEHGNNPSLATRSDSTQGDPDERADGGLPPLTDDVGTDRVTIKQEPSSDGPVFVSEHSLKKRKRDTGPPETPAARTIKTERENGWSSPELSLHHCDFNPHESPDLGDVAQMMLTPRKRRELGQSQHVTQPGNNESIRDPTPAPDSGDDHHPQKMRLTSALMPIDPNRQLPKSAAASPDKPLRKGLGRGIAVLAEDGAVYNKDTKGTSALPPESKPAVKGRLDTLLDSPSRPEEQSPIVRSARQCRGGTPWAPREELPIPKPRELPFEKRVAHQSGRRSDAHVARTPRTPLSETANTLQGSKPSRGGKSTPRSLLRNKPLSELRLDDFKVNPLANDGHDFAYSEVVRDKDERACLPGCVDMHCCGKKFRALALSQRPDPPLTAAQRQEEQKLLEEYLADNSYRLVGMTKEERAGLWVEAKMRELANKYGRHRHRFSRMQSPPGFWNADFPSTQELEAEKAEAAKRERQTIQERYHEAMRPGGRWIFQDE